MDDDSNKKFTLVLFGLPVALFCVAVVYVLCCTRPPTDKEPMDLDPNLVEKLRPPSYFGQDRQKAD